MRRAFQTATILSISAFAILTIWTAMVLSLGQHERTYEFARHNESMKVSGGQIVTGTGGAWLVTNSRGVFFIASI